MSGAGGRPQVNRWPARAPVVDEGVVTNTEVHVHPKLHLLGLLLLRVLFVQYRLNPPQRRILDLAVDDFFKGGFVVMAGGFCILLLFLNEIPLEYLRLGHGIEVDVARPVIELPPALLTRMGLLELGCGQVEVAGLG